MRQNMCNRAVSKSNFFKVPYTIGQLLSVNFIHVCSYLTTHLTSIPPPKWILSFKKNMLLILKAKNGVLPNSLLKSTLIRNSNWAWRCRTTQQELLRVSGIITDSHCHLNVTWNEPSLLNNLRKGSYSGCEDHGSWDPTAQSFGHNGCQISGAALITHILVIIPPTHTCLSDPVSPDGVWKMWTQISLHMYGLGPHSLSQNSRAACGGQSGHSYEWKGA